MRIGVGAVAHGGAADPKVRSTESGDGGGGEVSVEGGGEYDSSSAGSGLVVEKGKGVRGGERRVSGREDDG